MDCLCYRSEKSKKKEVMVDGEEKEATQNQQYWKPSNGEKAKSEGCDEDQNVPC